MPIGREIAEADEAGLERLRAADLAFEHAPDVEAEQDEARDRGVEERRLRAQQPAARGELREQQDRQRAGAVLPPAIITSAMQRMSPTSSVDTSAGSAIGSGSRWTIQNVSEPEDEVERRVRDEQRSAPRCRAP